MLSNEELLAFFGRAVAGDVAAALLVKFRAAEGRRGPLPKGYAAIMIRNHLIDAERKVVSAERAAARAVVEAAERIEADRKADEFVAAALQFDVLSTLEVVHRMTLSNREAVDMLRSAVVHGETLPEVAARFGLKEGAAYQRISRIRTALRPVCTALGFTALLAVAIDNRLSRLGGAINYR